MRRTIFCAAALTAFLSVAHAGQRGGAPPAPPSAQTSATNDLTGYWVTLVTEDWRWLMVVPPKGNTRYLRKNGVPYSEKAVITEYFQPTPETYGVRYMMVTTIIEDPEYLTGPLITSSNYKKLPDTNNGWDAQPCSVR
jgi:hypothetical protein